MGRAMEATMGYAWIALLLLLAGAPASRRYPWTPRAPPSTTEATGEHQRYGDQDSGTDNGYVWMQCSWARHAAG